MRNLYIDFDGVIVDTIKETYQMLEEQKISEKEDILKFYENLDWKELLKKVDVINDGIACIQKIIDSNRFDVSILTHINSLSEGIEKTKYIRKYFKDITMILVPKAISKTKMVQTKGSILIDDYAANLREWKTEDGIGIRFSSKKNGKGFPAIDRLDQILEMEF